MGWLGILLWVITHASDLISLVRIVIGLIGSLPKNQADSVRAAASDAISHHDKRKLKEVLEQATIGVASDVKGD